MIAGASDSTASNKPTLIEGQIPSGDVAPEAWLLNISAMLFAVSVEVKPIFGFVCSDSAAGF